MATIHMDSGISGMEQAYVPARRPLFAEIRWGAVWAGVAVGISVQLVLTLLGIAGGLSTTDVAKGETIGNGPLIWAGISMVIAAFVGGYVAAHLSGLKRKLDGILHGVVSWAVTTLLFAVLASSAGGSLMSGAFNALGQSNSSNSAASGGGNGASSGLAGMLRRLGINNTSPEALQTLQGYIQAGRREDAVQFMVNSMGVEPSRAGTIVDQALILSGSPEQASAQGRATADRVVSTASTAAWTVFLAVALSLALGAAGGALGANATHRRAIWAAGSGSRPNTGGSTQNSSRS